MQCYARLQHLLAHYELGNYELLEYLSRSVYRFMEKMQNLTLLEEEILRFLRRAFNTPSYKTKDELEKFLQQIKGFEKNRLQTRVFVYLDIISWVESKVYEKPVSEIIKQKYLKDKRSDQNKREVSKEKIA